MLVVVSRLGKLQVNFDPEHRLLRANLAGTSVGRNVEVLDADPALSREWAEQPR